MSSVVPLDRRRRAPDAVAFGGRPEAREMRASNWVEHPSGSLRGFFTLELASGLVLHGCSLHTKGERQWVGLPGKPLLADGQVKRDPATGKIAHTAVVEIPDRVKRDRFQQLAVAAVHRLLGGGGAA